MSNNLYIEKTGLILLRILFIREPLPPTFFVIWVWPMGPATTCYVALHPQVKGVSGKYFSDSNLSKITSHGTDADLVKKIWDFSMNLIKLHYSIILVF
ncbi:short-chain dehydrogenase TIC 32, chloroplastic [Arachis duranensis]|uniref:Short-chain dehydrogenase TIC 32, chloroplastic n=1 Tax=Arachis duranensis TaxID=130453 RepID=A0A6P4CWR3_ARADU|nr:short-chain dehydrogenase TIC 32, chloroplastic [Arachis duranensis]